MAAAFSAEEKEKIQQALLDSALKYASTLGMKKTSVDMLVEEAGISKGAFYSFYASKELLFLDMLDHWHRDICREAAISYQKNATLPTIDRVALMLQESIHRMAYQPLDGFLKTDVPMLLRRLPPSIVNEHYQSDDDFIRSLIRLTGVSLLVTESVAVAVIRILFMSLIHAQQVGEHFTPALNALVYSACRQLIRSQ